MDKHRILFLVTAIALLAGCSVERIPGVYRIDIQQGNVVTREMVDQLEPGMTREQVRFVMGSPMLTDPFHVDRWDYYYGFRPGNGSPERRHIVVHFENDRFTRIAGDLPAADPNAVERPRSIEVTGARADDRGVLRRAWDRLTDWGDDDEPGATE